MSNIEHLSSLMSVEQYPRYQTYGKLRETNQRIAGEYPELARIETVGYGADRTPKYPAGRPIEILIVSDPEAEAARPYVLKKLGHENELPATLDQLASAETLCRNPDLLEELGHNFIFSTTEHPDGIALQQWVEDGDGAFDPVIYALGFYRSSAAEQVAWGYPFRYGNANFSRVTPEVAASMYVMQKYKPTVMHEVHASGIDDIYFYLSHPSEAFNTQLAGIASLNGFVMQRGEPEIPYVRKIGPGLYHPVFSARLAYDYGAKHTGAGEMQWSSGTTSAEYLSRIVNDPFVIVSEVPYLTTDALRDMSPSGMTRREAGLADIETHRRLIAIIARYYLALELGIRRSGAADVGRLARSVAWWHTQGAPARIAVEEGAIEAPEFARQATVAEAYSAMQRWEFYSTTFLGQVHHLARRLGEEDMASEISGEVRKRIAAINEVSPLRVSPLPNLIGAQALTGIAAVEQSKLARSQ